MLMDVNRVLMSLTDKAEIGAASSSVSGGGAWKAITDQYIFSSGVNIGATVDLPGGGLDTLLMLGGPFSEIRPGRLEPFETRSGAMLPGSDLGVFWLSSDPGDLANFPLVCTVDEFRIGLFPSLAPFLGEPFPGFADLTVCFAANDVDGSTCSKCGGTRLGAETNQTYFAFSIPAVQDYFFVAMRVFNRSNFVTSANTPGNNVFGPYDFNDTVVAIAIDPDLGEATDDQIGFLPAPTNTMVWWDSDFDEPAFQFLPPGFGGVSYLKTPVDPATGEEVGLQSFTVFTNGGSRPDPSSRQEWYQGLTGDPDFVVFDVIPQDIRGLASSGQFPLPAGEFVEIYAAYFFAEAFGPTPGELTTDNAIVNGEPIALFNNFIAAQAGVQAVFDAGFLLPTAPPSPGGPAGGPVELIPADHQVTVLWGNTPIVAVNPFAKIALDPFLRDETGAPDPDAPGLGLFVPADQVVFAPALDMGGTTGFVSAAVAGLTGVEVTNPFWNSDFVIQDFQGFRVYRSFTGNTDDAELIAQFDLTDGIVAGNFCVEGTTVPTTLEPGEEPFAVICKVLQAFPLGNDAGLLFGLTDRGGVFPTPSEGPGLINGIPVYYAVTSYSVNCGVTTVAGLQEEGTPTSNGFILDLDAPPACLTLESGKNLNPATPRSNSSAFVGATVVGDAVLVDGAGNPLPLDSGPIPVDAAGALSGPIPPARDWSLSVDILQPLEIPPDFEVLVHIDDMPMSSAWNTGFCPVPTAVDCEDADPGTFEDHPAGDGRGVMMKLRVTDGNGTVLQTLNGPADDIRQAFGPLNFTPTTGTEITGPPIQILSPLDPSKGPAFTIQYTTRIPGRAYNCALRRLCQLLDQSGGGLPASVASVDFDRFQYGQPVVADVEVTWSNQGGVLSLSRVHDISNNSDYPGPDPLVTAGWGFAAATSMRPAEAAVAEALGSPKTAAGKYLFPSGFCFGGFTSCDIYGLEENFTQGGSPGAWTDLVSDPDIFSKLPQGTYLTDFDLMQPDGLSATASIVTVGGQPATRLKLGGHWVNLVFNTLPTDGETWLFRFPTSASDAGPGASMVHAGAPRPPTPGTAVRVQIAGGTNILAAADLQQITVVPNPFIAANEITRGRGRQRVLFTNLPPQATIRIYTISGNLVRILEHGDGSGTAEWDVRTRFDLLVASGNYYYHVTTPDGRTHLGRFAVIN
jgi:hypothetical protein